MCSLHVSPPVEQPRAAKVWASVSAQWRWVRRPELAARGWANGVVILNGAYYTVQVEYDRFSTIVDFVKAITGTHSRVTVRPRATECDCADATFRNRTCKHLSCASELLAELDATTADYAA